MSKSICARRPGRSTGVLLSAAAVAAAGLFAASPAGADITLGPPRASDGLPAYIVDDEGIAIAPCETATPVRDCGGAFDPADPTYWDAGGQAGPIRVVYSVSSPRGGRIARFTGDALTPGRYKIQDPWGTVNCQADAQGGMDCRLPGRRITTLLRATTAPAGFIGSANANRTFTGSPTGFNRVLITGPRSFRASTSHLAITGLLRANTAMSAISKDALTLGRPRNAAPVVKNVHYTSFGTAAARPTVRLAGADANAFKVRNPCRSVAPGRGCNISVAFRPRQHVNQTVRARLLINDNGLAPRRTVKLTGVGLAG